MVLGVACARSYEVRAEGHGWDYGFITQREAPEQSDHEFGGAIERIARDERVAIVGFQLGPTSAAHEGALYVTPGTRRTDGWLRNGRYPAFSPEMQRPVARFATLTGTRGGLYAVVGPPSSRKRLLAALERLGVRPRAVQVATPWQSIGIAAERPHGALLLLSFLMVTALGAAGSLLAAKATAVQQLQGRSFWSQMAAATPGAGRTFAASVALTAAVTAIALAVYNGLHGVDLLLAFWLPIGAGLLATWCMSFAGTLALVRVLPVLPRLAGRVESWPAYLLAFAVAGAALAIAIGISFDARRETGLHAARSKLALQPGVANQVQVSMRSSAEDPQLVQREKRVGRWLAGEAAAGRAIIAQHDLAQFVVDPQRRLPLAPRTQAFVVNAAYLATHPVRDSAGRLIKASDGAAKVFFPSGVAIDRRTRSVTDSYMQNLQQARRAQADTGSAAAPLIRAHIASLAPRTALFAYPSPTAINNPESPYVVDPVVIVLPRHVATFSDRDLTSLLEQGALLLNNRRSVIEGLRRRHLLEFVGTTRTIGEWNTRLVSEGLLRSLIYKAALLLAVLFAILAFFSLAQIYVLRNRSKIAVRGLHGWGALRMHWLVAAAFTATAGLAALFALRRADTASLVTAIVEVAPPPPHWIPLAAVAASIAFFALMAHCLSTTSVSDLGKD